MNIRFQPDDRIPIHLDPDLMEDDQAQACFNLLIDQLQRGGFYHGHESNPDFLGDSFINNDC